MKKRLLSAGLAVALALSCVTVAMAENQQDIIETNRGTATHDVYASYVAIAEAPTVYAVEIKWGSMEFTYNAATVTKTWDPETHTYTENSGTEGKWTTDENDGDKISLTNRSNKALTATVESTINNEYSGITAKASAPTLTLADASTGATTEQPGTASTAETTITLSGELTKTDANKTPIGSITVTIEDADTKEETQP